MQIPVTAIFDIGKTNKKFFLFDDDLKEVHQEYMQLNLIEDDDGEPCEDLESLIKWMRSTLMRALKSRDYNIKQLNFSGYGASMVHLDSAGKPVTPLYNYLNPYPKSLQQQFSEKYGEMEQNDLETASPSLGMLNSGMQLYWLKYSKPKFFHRIKHSLHFPQFLSYLFTGELVSEPTSIGCHTKLWDFRHNHYHQWIIQEGLDRLLPKIVPTVHHYYAQLNGQSIKTGVGVHDSSAALVPYIIRSTEPFILISTGTWSITLNPFTTEPLSMEELKKDCLTYLSINSKPVKAARLFIGNEMEYQMKVLNDIYHKDPEYYQSVSLNEDFIAKVASGAISNRFFPKTIKNPLLLKVLDPNSWDPNSFNSYEEAYHHLVWGLVTLQRESLQLVNGNSPIKNVYMDGGFIHNDLFNKMLQYQLPDYSFNISSVPMGSAYGAALVITNEAGKSGLAPNKN
ncbi:MAG: hypothetical protein DHS20C17_35890 [Cyclobacteriaceae bacterium]|nr:MAG: hypothetical protein DHS20C17_35890 [Cyclobacteriaceae bacterium]